MFAGWVGRQQSAVITYLIEENRVLKEQLESGGRLLRFTDEVKEQGILPSPDRPVRWRTFVRSHAHLIAAADFFTTELWDGVRWATSIVFSDTSLNASENPRII
jgi:hypothetical protein